MAAGRLPRISPRPASRRCSIRGATRTIHGAGDGSTREVEEGSLPRSDQFRVRPVEHGARWPGPYRHSPPSPAATTSFGPTTEVSMGSPRSTRRNFRSFWLPGFGRELFGLFVLCALGPIVALALLSWSHVSAELREQSRARMSAGDTQRRDANRRSPDADRRGPCPRWTPSAGSRNWVATIWQAWPSWGGTAVSARSMAAFRHRRGSPKPSERGSTQAPLLRESEAGARC